MVVPARPQQNPHPAPATPTSANKPAAQGAQGCPVHDHIPCNCKSLTVTCVVNDYGKDATRKLETKKKKRGEPLPKGASKRTIDLLGKYDFVIDMVGGYYTKQDQNPDKVKVTGKGEHVGNCGFHVHPAMCMKGLGPVPELPKGEEWKKGDDIGPKEFTAREVDQDITDPSGIMVIIDIIKSLWPLYNPKQIEVKEVSCGILPKGAKEEPATDLIALVRIFRHDKYAIGLKMPALFKVEESQSGTLTGEKSFDSDRKTSNTFGRNQTSSTAKVEGDEYKYTQSSQRGGTGSAYSTSGNKDERHFSQQSTSGEGTKYDTKDDVTTVGTMKKLERSGRGFELFISRNGREFGKEIEPGEKKSKVDMVLDGIDKAIDALSKLHHMFKKLPQVGWKFSFEMSLLQGELALEWESKHVKEPKFDERYYAVEHKMAVTIAMHLIYMKIDLSFGVEAMAAGTGVSVKVGGYVSLDIPVQAELTIDDGKPAVEVSLRPEAKVAIYGDGKASVFGWSLADVHVDVTACFDMQDGKLEFSKEHCIELKGHLKSEKVNLNGYAKFPHMPIKRLTPRMLLDEFPIYTFG